MTDVATHGAPDIVCHFETTVRHGRRHLDQYGRLRMTTDWLTFRGSTDLSVAWTEVSAVRRAADLIVIVEVHQRSLRFACRSVAEAARAAVVADHLRQLASSTAITASLAFPAL